MGDTDDLTEGVIVGDTEVEIEGVMNGRLIGDILGVVHISSFVDPKKISVGKVIIVPNQ